MTHSLYRFKERLVHSLLRRPRQGYGIHSPYLYRFITCILEEELPYYCFERRDLNPKTGKGDPRIGQLLFRMVQDAQFDRLLEWGAETGLETQYLLLANPKAKCISTCFRDSKKWAVKQKPDWTPVEYRQIESGKDADAVLEELENLGLVFFNQLPDGKTFFQLFEKCLSKKRNDSIFLIRNIHQSPDMKAAWEKIQTLSDVRVTLDLYDFGLVLFNPELERKNYLLHS